MRTVNDFINTFNFSSDYSLEQAISDAQEDAYNQAIDDAARSLIQTENQWGSEYLDQKQKILNLNGKTINT